MSKQAEELLRQIREMDAHIARLIAKAKELQESCRKEREAIFQNRLAK